MTVKCTATMFGRPCADVEYDEGTFIGLAAKEYQKENPNATAAECLKVGRQRLAAAQADQREREAKISDAEIKKHLVPETAEEKKARAIEETRPAVMTDEQYLRWMVEQLGLKNKDWDMAKLLREARKDMLKTQAIREKNRKEECRNGKDAAK